MSDSNPISLDERVGQAAQRLVDQGPDAIAGMYDLTAKRLFRYASSITRQSEDAEDAIQAALIKVASQPTGVADADRPWAYLLRMVRNESLMVMRRRRPWVSLVGTTLADCFGRSVGWHVDPVVTQERNAAVWDALEGLPVAQREVVVLKIWEAMTFATIAEVLAVSPDTVASRYRYALKKLSRILVDHQVDDLGCGAGTGSHISSEAAGDHV